MEIHYFYKFIENLKTYLPRLILKVDGQLLESFNIKKGVRQGQGCSLSLILFNFVH